MELHVKYANNAFFKILLHKRAALSVCVRV